MKNIPWRKTIEEAVNEISGGTRLLMLCFHDEKNEGSKKVLRDVLTDDQVLGILEREFVPLSFDINKDTKMVEKYNVDWAPTFIIADENGRELERCVGYLPKEDFIAHMLLSKGLSDFHLKRYRDAETEFEQLIDEYKGSDLVPEAEYFLGVTKYKETGDTYHLGEICEKLQEKYPESSWTKRCSIWSGIQARRPYVAFDQGGAGGSGAY